MFGFVSSGGNSGPARDVQQQAALSRTHLNLEKPLEFLAHCSEKLWDTGLSSFGTFMSDNHERNLAGLHRVDSETLKVFADITSPPSRFSFSTQISLTVHKDGAI